MTKPTQPIYAKEMQAILESDQSDLDKVIQAFDLITHNFLQASEREIDVYLALKDEENIIKERIKHGVMQSARDILDDCHRKVTGRTAWHE